MRLRTFALCALVVISSYLAARRLLRKPLQGWVDLAVLLLFLGCVLFFVIPEVGLGILRLLGPNAFGPLG